MMNFWRFLHPKCNNCNFNGRLFKHDVYNELGLKTKIYKCGEEYI